MPAFQTDFLRLLCIVVINECNHNGFGNLFYSNFVS